MAGGKRKVVALECLPCFVHCYSSTHPLAPPHFNQAIPLASTTKHKVLSSKFGIFICPSMVLHQNEFIESSTSACASCVGTLKPSSLQTLLVATLVRISSQQHIHFKLTSLSECKIGKETESRLSLSSSVVRQQHGVTIMWRRNSSSVACPRSHAVSISSTA